MQHKRWLSLIINFFQMPAVPHKLDFLDGYRGFSALTVILQHFTSVFQLTDTDYKVFKGIGTVGLVGFFTLSAFLLTYRVISAYDNAKTNRIRLLKTIQFLIRRLFRIYFPFITFWTILYSLPTAWDKYIIMRPKISYIDGILLRTMRGSHLWTVPVEIRYYFYIPVISYICVKFGKYWYIFELMLISVIYSIEHYSLLGHRNTASPFYLLPIFLNGSVTAILYYNIRRHERIHKVIRTPFIKRLLGAIVLVSTYIQFRYNHIVWDMMYLQKIETRFRPGYIIAGTLTLLLFSAPNLLSSFYSIHFLRTFGRLSYGIYLYQYIVFGVVLSIKNWFDLSIEPLIITILLCYALGHVWTFTVENAFMRMSESICLKLEKTKYFYHGQHDHHFNTSQHQVVLPMLQAN